MARVLSLCTGYGGIEMALALAGVNVELVAVADPHPAAARLLAHHHPDVPNLGDITAVDWTRAPRADVITAGYPCQPFSLAGRRAGTNDERAIWDDIHAAIRDLRPGTVLLENVPGHLSLGFGRVVGDLASIGYVGSWRCVRASDVGAPHKRERVFILAWPAENGGPGIAADVARRMGGAGVATGGDLSLLPTPRASDTGTAGRRCSPGFRPPLSEVLLPTPRTSDAQGSGAHGTGGPEIRTAVTLLPTPRASDGTNGGPNMRGSKGDLPLPSAVVQLLPTPAAARSGRQRSASAGAAIRPSLDTLGSNAARFGPYAPAIERWESILGRPAPDPTEDGAKGNQRLSARFVEWLMGLPAGYVTAVPSLPDSKLGAISHQRHRNRAAAVEGLTRNEQLRLLGNGVVTQQGAHAIRQMVTS